MSSSERDVQVEKILQQVGDNGRYQKILFWVFLVPINIIIPWTALVQVFQTSVPDHWCYVPGRPENASLEVWKNLTIPRKQDGKYSKCQQFVAPSFGENWNDSYFPPQVTECQNGWEYDDTWYDSTLATERNWVCERSSFSARWLSAGIFGNVIGTLLFSIISDYWGRKIGIVLTTQVYAVFALLRLFVTSDMGDLILMFLSSMPFPSNLEIALIWVMEQVSTEMRAKITSVSFIMWTFGMCVIPLLAWLTRSWVILGIMTSLPFMIFFVIWWIFPESPRWLLSRGEVDKSFIALKKIANCNRIECPKDLKNTLQKLAEKDETEKKSFFSNLSFIDLLRGKVVRKRLLLLTLCYVCNNTIYYGIILNTTNISGNEFLNFFYLSVSELPGNMVAWFSAQTIGRRLSEAGFFLLATIAAVVSIFLADSGSWAEISVLVTCKTLINVSYLVVYIQAAELLPTSHRAVGIGFSSIVTSIIGISAPYIAYSSSHWSSLPYIILTLIGFMGTVTALFLPETLGKDLPQTIPDAEIFLINQPFWSYLGWRPKK